MPVSMATSSNIPSLKNCKKNHIPLKEIQLLKLFLIQTPTLVKSIVYGLYVKNGQSAKCVICTKHWLLSVKMWIWQRKGQE
jgi:hypothetical protein